MKPLTIAIDGHSSTGKSTLAKQLALKLEQSGGLDRPFQKVKPCSVGVMLRRGRRCLAKGHRTTRPSPYDLRSCPVVEVDSYDDDSTPRHGQG